MINEALISESIVIKTVLLCSIHAIS